MGIVSRERGKEDMTIRVRTSMMDGKIMQTVESDLNGMMTELFNRTMDTRDAHIREALIGMGWAPPKEESDEG